MQPSHSLTQYYCNAACGSAHSCSPRTPSPHPAKPADCSALPVRIHVCLPPNSEPAAVPHPIRMMQPTSGDWLALSNKFQYSAARRHGEFSISSLLPIARRVRWPDRCLHVDPAPAGQALPPRPPRTPLPRPLPLARDINPLLIRFPCLFDLACDQPHTREHRNTAHCTAVHSIRSLAAASHCVLVCSLVVPCGSRSPMCLPFLENVSLLQSNWAPECSTTPRAASPVCHCPFDVSEAHASHAALSQSYKVYHDRHRRSRFGSAFRSAVCRFCSLHRSWCRLAAASDTRTCATRACTPLDHASSFAVTHSKHCSRLRSLGLSQPAAEDNV